MAELPEGQSYGAGGGATAFGGGGGGVVASGMGGRGSGGFAGASFGGVSVACACPKPAARTPMQELLDHCIAEASALHGPALADPVRIYENMAKRVLAAMLAE